MQWGNERSPELLATGETALTHELSGSGIAYEFLFRSDWNIGVLPMLTEQDAVRIYECKLTRKLQVENGVCFRSLRGQSGAVSKQYGVTSRTVRDIWNRQTWAFATRHLWFREAALEAGSGFVDNQGKIAEEVRSAIPQLLKQLINIVSSMQIRSWLLES